MEFNNCKRSISRKSLFSLCRQQRDKIMKEVRKNLRSQYRKKCSTSITVPINNHDIHIPGPSVSFSVDNVDDIDDYGHNDFSSSDEFSSASSSLSFDTSFCETIRIEPSFRECLASCFIDNNLTHIQGNSILNLLRTHFCFNNLPKDVRTLLDTPRARVITL